MSEGSKARARLAPATLAVSIAATIASDEQRRRFRDRPLANDRIARLALDLG